MQHIDEGACTIRFRNYHRSYEDRGTRSYETIISDIEKRGMENYDYGVGLERDDGSGATFKNEKNDDLTTALRREYWIREIRLVRSKM